MEGVAEMGEAQGLRETQLLFCPHRETGQRQVLPWTARQGQPCQFFIAQHCHLPVVAHRHRTPAHVQFSLNRRLRLSAGSRGLDG